MGKNSEEEELTQEEFEKKHFVFKLPSSHKYLERLLTESLV